MKFYQHKYNQGYYCVYEGVVWFYSAFHARWRYSVAVTKERFMDESLYVSCTVSDELFLAALEVMI